MNLQNFIYLLLSAVWLTGLIWAGMIVFKVKSKEKNADHSESLNLDSGPMNARKLKQKEGRESDE